MCAATPRRGSLLYKKTILSIAAVAAALGAKAESITSDWDAGGDDTKWSTAANWSNDTVPVATDNAVQFKNAASGKTVTFDGVYTLGGYTYVGETTSAVTWEASDPSYGIDSSAKFALADNAVTGTLTIKSGTYKFGAGAWTWSEWGKASKANATLVMDGGLLSIGALAASENGGASAITINGGTFEVNPGLELCKNNTGSATITVNEGGTFMVKKIREFGTGAEINANGGVFVPVEASTEYLKNATITIGEKGLVISNDVAVTLAATLTAGSGVSSPKLVKLGSGPLTLNDTQMGVLGNVEVKSGAVILPSAGDYSGKITASGGYAWKRAETGYTMVGGTAADGATYWVGASDYSWNTAGNWSTGTAPVGSKSEHAGTVILPNGTYISSLGGATAYVQKLKVEGTVTIKSEWNELYIYGFEASEGAKLKLNLKLRNGSESEITLPDVEWVDATWTSGFLATGKFKIGGKLTGGGHMKLWDYDMTFAGDNSGFTGTVEIQSGQPIFTTAESGFANGALVAGEYCTSFKTAFDTGTIHFGTINNVYVSANEETDGTPTTYKTSNYISNGSSANVTIEVGSGKLVLTNSFEGAVTIKKVGEAALEFESDQSNVSLDIAGAMPTLTADSTVNELTVEASGTLALASDGYKLTASSATFASGSTITLPPVAKDNVKMAVTGTATVGGANFTVASDITQETFDGTSNYLMSADSFGGEQATSYEGSIGHVKVLKKTYGSTDYLRAMIERKGLVIIFR